MRKAFLITIAVLLALLSASQKVSADGCALPELRMALPEMPVQRALVRYKDGRETLVIESTIDGKGQRFGWIIPLPTAPDLYSRISPGLLKTLSFQLQPEIKHQTLGPKGIALLAALLVLVVIPCSVGLAFGAGKGVLAFIGLAIPLSLMTQQFMVYGSGGPMEASRTTVMIEDSQVIGNYEIVVLNAQSSTDLNTWLVENDFNAFPDNALPIIEAYIDRNWVFIAAKLLRTTDGVSTPHPLLIEFRTESPVYPMQLTALNASNMYLELFVIADQEAFPIGYKLSKEYCNRFKTQTINPGDRSYENGFEQVFVEDEGFEFYTRRIGHLDSRKLMWDACVVTKLVGYITRRKMKRDLIIRFQPVSPARAVRYSYEGAIESALLYAYGVFMIGFLIVTLFYSERAAAYAKNPWKPSPSFFNMLAALLMICLIVGLGVYLHAGEKIQVNSHSSKLYSEWSTFRMHVVDIFSEPGLDDLTDDELIELFAENDLRNPFTNEPVLIEDSPGNLTVERVNGEFVKMNFIFRDGMPRN
jgi:hypothetical protein